MIDAAKHGPEYLKTVGAVTTQCPTRTTRERCGQAAGHFGPCDPTKGPFADPAAAHDAQEAEAELEDSGSGAHAATMARLQIKLQALTAQIAGVEIENDRLRRDNVRREGELAGLQRAYDLMTKRTAALGSGTDSGRTF